ncbi:phenylacetate--CoA ligase family protein [Dethiosulfatarculus sandiegensis]|uniref:Phenylacetate-coenzyme A ligase n=1 Tax=Dethiosulfatarculus sandiegensis TaxID=1429043 RepID=A0A0D2JJU2_9BACT|nr:phenylacetate--CoA ligase [Dethiosulfatarculus sandiegensis]KIX15911.1 phenylacetate-CoA ligase [Dethiosulfatarculus sandiegensis]
MKAYWNQEMETMPEEELKALQLAKLQETVEWVYDRVPFYRKAMEDRGVRPGDIKSLADIALLPFTVKTDLRDNYPFGLCAVPKDQVVQIHASSGTTGKPVTGPYTEQDLANWAECMARNLWAAGIRPGDVVQNAYGYGLFTGGLGLHQGARRISAAVVPASSGMTERQITLMKDFGTKALFCTPSYALTIAEKARELGVDLRNLPLSVGVFGAEPWSEEMKREIESRMGLVAHEVYGLTEMGGPGVAFSCSGNISGLHINEDHYIAEVVDPLTLEPLPLGEVGELVFTSIQRRAMPLLRYRTRDITRLVRKKCSCGRTFLVMEKVLGRDDDMMIISGVNVFPSQVESILLDIKEVEPQYVIIIKKQGHLDRLHVDVEASKSVYEKGPEKVAMVEKDISSKIKGIIGISVSVRLVPPKTLMRSEGKAQRVRDTRMSRDH